MPAQIPKRFLQQIFRIARDNGCEITEGRSGVRVTRDGRVLIVHRTPSRPEVYRKSLRLGFRQKLGIDVPLSEWPR